MVSTRQLKALGYTRSSAAKAAKVGRLHRIHRGVYAVGHTDLTHRGRVTAAVLAHQPAVASHWTAGWLWGLFRTNSAIHLTAASRRHRRSGARVHFAALAPADVCAAGAIPLTSLARTILDLAPLVDAKRLASLLERAEQLTDDDGRKLFDLREFESLLRRTVGHPGNARLNAALRIYRPDPAFLRSNLERDFRALIRASSLPLPSQNFIVGPYELDAYWPEQRFCVELDTYGTHGSRRSFEEDRKRQRYLRRHHGIEVERVTEVQLEEEPGEVLAALAAALDRRRRTRALD